MDLTGSFAYGGDHHSDLPFMAFAGESLVSPTANTIPETVAEGFRRVFLLCKPPSMLGSTSQSDEKNLGK